MKLNQVFLLQGLRTLELCVDNLQPDFLYDHIQPVRAELMQVTAYFLLLILSLKCLFMYVYVLCIINIM